MHSPLPQQKPLFWRIVIMTIHIMTACACVALIVMMLTTCLDVGLRRVWRPIKGAYDIVKICSAITIACAMPLTTALKGHIAIEYFFQKLNRMGRLVVDSLMRVLMIGAFVFATYACVRHGISFYTHNEVSATLELPIFWVPWLMACAFGVSAMAVVFHLIYPGRGMMKP